MAHWQRFCYIPSFGSRLCGTVPAGVVGVSSYGRVQNKCGVVHWGCRHQDGYHRASIGRRSFLVHRLVAHAFLGPPQSDDCFEVNHIDGNKSNNRVVNLEYLSHSQNMLHSFKTNPVRRSGAQANSRLASTCGFAAQRLGSQLLWARQVFKANSFMGFENRFRLPSCLYI